VAPREGRRDAWVGIALALTMGVAIVLGVAALLGRGGAVTLPDAERCVASAGNSAVVVDLEQARYASIIAGISVRRGLPPRAASIALATAYQETDIRNLDYGDRDSLGLFQQRPSQGWGTPAQLQDPHYATNAFYDALVRVSDWESGDITEVAQRVQRSGYPDAYRDHEADARVLASALTGRSRAAFTCQIRNLAPGDPDGLAAAMEETFGRASVTAKGQTVNVVARRTTDAWAQAHFAVANAARYGVVAVRIGDREWRTDADRLPPWADAVEPLRRLRIEVTLR